MINIEIDFDGTIVWNEQPVPSFATLEGYFKQEAQRIRSRRSTCGRIAARGTTWSPMCWPRRSATAWSRSGSSTLRSSATEPRSARRPRADSVPFQVSGSNVTPSLFVKFMPRSNMSKSYVAAIAVAVALAVGGITVTNSAMAAEEKERSARAPRRASRPCRTPATRRNGTTPRQGADLPGAAEPDHVRQVRPRAVRGAGVREQEELPEGGRGDGGAARDGQGLGSRTGAPAQDADVDVLPGQELPEGRRDGPATIKAGAADAETYTIVAQSYYLRRKYQDTVQVPERVRERPGEERADAQGADAAAHQRLLHEAEQQ